MSAPPGWVPVRSALPGIDVWKPAPEAPPPARCPRCGGPIGVATSGGGCGFCAWEPDPPGVRSAGPAPLTRGAMQAGPWLGRKRVSCVGCGAERADEDGVHEVSCSFCGSSDLVSAGSDPATATPTPASLIPHDPTVSGGRRAFTPVWVFDVSAEVTWQARVGREARTGRLAFALANFLVPACRRAPARGPLDDLEPFAPARLVGAQVFVPDVPLTAAFDVARHAARGRGRELAHERLGPGHRRLSLTVRTLSEGWRLILWPVWLSGGPPATVRDGRAGGSR